jgi:hypothetical protein
MSNLYPLRIKQKEIPGAPGIVVTADGDESSVLRRRPFEENQRGCLVFTGLFFEELTHRCEGLDMIAKYLENR